jgi:hypothetical protein
MGGNSKSEGRRAHDLPAVAPSQRLELAIGERSDRVPHTFLEELSGTCRRV